MVKHPENQLCKYDNIVTHRVTTTLLNTVIYYYRLYTKKDDGSWTSARTTSGKTQVGVIRKFPFVEDFKTGKLDDAWKLESIISNKMFWKVEYEENGYNLQTAFEADEWGSESPRGKEKCRLILPQIDFTDVKNAYICLDYSSFLSEFKIEYRMSSIDKWHTLNGFDTMLGNNVPGNNRDEIEKNATSRVYIELPNLTNTYELSFVATYFVIDGIRDVFLERARVKNIVIETDYDLKVITGDIAQTKNTSAIVSTMVLDGAKTHTQKGAEWSEDKSVWTKCISTGDTVFLSNLPSGKTVYYRAFAVDENGLDYQGEIKEMRTTQFCRGEGSSENPYIISSSEDWNELLQQIDNGNEFEGVYFSLNQSFCLESNEKTTRSFSGTLNGCGYTISLANGNYDYLITIVR